jgi:hypothetical protein
MPPNRRISPESDSSNKENLAGPTAAKRMDPKGKGKAREVDMDGETNEAVESRDREGIEEEGEYDPDQDKDEKRHVRRGYRDAILAAEGASPFFLASPVSRPLT